MKFNGSITINKPQSLVTKMFVDSSTLKEWQDGFVRKEIVEGEEGKEGAISKMYYKQGKREMELTETILTNQLPDSIESFYHHKHMDNTMKCTFIAVNDSQTRYDYEIEYTRISWIMPRLMFTLFPGMFRKQGEKWMNQFKEFVEKQ